MEQRKIPFSPPDITESEIMEVAKTLESGWITTGPRTKLLERRLPRRSKASPPSRHTGYVSALTRMHQTANTYPFGRSRDSKRNNGSIA